MDKHLPVTADEEILPGPVEEHRGDDRRTRIHLDSGRKRVGPRESRRFTRLRAAPDPGTDGEDVTFAQGLSLPRWHQKLLLAADHPEQETLAGLARHYGPAAL